MIYKTGQRVLINIEYGWKPEDNLINIPAVITGKFNDNCFLIKFEDEKLNKSKREEWISHFNSPYEEAFHEMFITRNEADEQGRLF